MRLGSLLQHAVPKTLRAKFFLMALVTVSIPILSTGYILEIKGREALLEEKQTKLFGLAKLLDAHLGDGFDALLKDYKGDPRDRMARIFFLNERLRDYTDIVAEANPGAGVGYYSRELNAIITYGPSRESGGTVGMPIPSTHPGWKVMEKGEASVESGHLVRGHIMNAMWPIVRNGKVIGYIWSNEFTEAIELQARAIDRAIVLAMSIGLAISLGVGFALSKRVTRDVRTITDGLQRMQVDMREPIRPLRGEMGEIGTAVNDMAKALLDARSLNENILMSIADGVITVDVEGAVTSVNPAAEELIGHKAEEVLGRPYAGLFRPGAGFTSLLLDTLRSGQEHIGVSLDVPLRNKTIHVSSSTSLLRDGSGRMIGAVAVIKDISETRRLQQQVMRADRLAALGELVAGIAHDIRNPLTSIRGFVQYLQRSSACVEWQEYAPLIIREVDGLNRIITELLHFARPCPPRYALVQVNDLIAEMLLLVKNRADKQDIRIDLKLDPALKPIEADGEQLKQVLLNLFINACQAMQTKGVITLSTWMESPDLLSLSIADNGTGIPAADLERVFDPFFSTKPAGTGLGLPVVQRIINGHQGKIEILSRDGGGTTITIHLPRVHAAEGTHESG